MAKERFIAESKVEDYKDRWREYCGYGNPITKREFKKVINAYYSALSDQFIKSGSLRIPHLGKCQMITFKLKKPKMITEGNYSTNAIKCYYIDKVDTLNYQINFNKRLIGRAYKDFKRVLAVYKRSKS